MIPKKKPKIKIPKLSTLVTKADTVCSIYIRMKYADHAGCITCITCGAYMPWKDSQNAHYIERGHHWTRYLEENLHPACASCNFYHKEFHKRQYTLAMIDLYGREKITELEELSRKPISASQKRTLALDAIEYYGKAVHDL